MRLIDIDTRGLDGPMERARSLGERLLPRRSGLDEKAFADLILSDLQADGLISAVVPTAFGGFGLGVGDVARITQHIAQISGSAALLYAMHMSQLLSVVRHGRSPFFEELQRRAVRDQLVFASGTSERGLGGDILHSLCTIEATPDGGLQVTKDIPNISYIDHTGVVLISAMLAEGKTPTQVLVAADARDIDFRPGREVGFIGMRGILNCSYELTARFPREAIFAQPYPVIARETMSSSIHVFWAAVWCGLAQRALATAKTFIAKENKGGAELAPVISQELTLLADKVHAMNALVRDGIADLEADDSPGGMGAGMAKAARSNRLKVTCARLVNEVTYGALELVGIRGYAAGGPYSLSEPLRDAMSASVMVSNYRLSANNAKLERYVDDQI